MGMTEQEIAKEGSEDDMDEDESTPALHRQGGKDAIESFGGGESAV